MSAPTYDVIITGCGPSGATPSVRCLTRPKDSTFPPCHCCMGAADPEDKLGYGGLKNYRSNTSGVVTKTWPDGRKSTIVIDCGKQFHERICKVFPENGLRKIDAVLLTHEHADAILGVGDLRHITLHGEIQDSVPVWCDQATYDIMVSRFPYLVDVGKSRSAGQQSSLKFHILEYGETVEIAGMKIRPLPVLHGCASKTVVSATAGAPPEVVVEKMTCAAFEFDDDQLLWMSDVNEIPDTTWSKLKFPQQQAIVSTKIKNESEGEYDSGFEDDVEDLAITSSVVQARQPDNDGGVTMTPLSISQTADHYKLVILDGCNLTGTITHIGMPEWMNIGLRLQADKMVLVQIEHYMSYGELVSLGQEIQGQRPDNKHDDFIAMAKKYCLKEPGLWEKCMIDGFWVRPGFDGQRFRIEPNGVPIEY